MKLRIIIPCVMLALSFVLMNCKDNDDNDCYDEIPEQPTDPVAIDTLKNVFGRIYYNEVISRWYISIHVEGTIDSVNCYYPLDMSSEFQQEGLRVIFSGNVYEMDSSLLNNYSVPAGTECFMIDLLDIYILEKGEKW